MPDNYVSREEFENLKEKVDTLENEVNESKKLLQTIDKKIDIINEKIVNNDKVDELKLEAVEQKVEAVETRVNNLEENKKWIRNTIKTAIISIVIGAIVFVIKQM